MVVVLAVIAVWRVSERAFWVRVSDADREREREKESKVKRKNCRPAVAVFVGTLPRVFIHVYTAAYTYFTAGVKCDTGEEV